jgi:CheY-like chemotaxis protein
MNIKLNCILLIDDDDDDNYFHQMIIDEMNITEHIEIALNGLEALAYLTDENKPKPDLVFLDVNMPKMNGWEFLKEHHDLPEKYKANIIVVMLTTSTNPEDKKRAAQYSEVTDFNCKPLTKEMLTIILERYFPEILPAE